MKKYMTLNIIILDGYQNKSKNKIVDLKKTYRKLSNN